MIKQRAVYIAAFLINIFVFLLCNTYQPLVIAALMLVSPLISLLFLAIFTATLRVECDCGTVSEAGQPFCASVSIFTPLHIIPGEISFVSRSVNRMFSDENIQKIRVKISHGENKVTLPIQNSVCGIVDFRLEDLSCRDMLNLFSFKTKFFFGKEISVYPRTMSLNALFEKSFSVERDGVVHDAYKKGSDASEILELRKYSYGDSVRNIHWKLSSKLGETIVRELSRPTDLKVLIFCDISLFQNGKRVDKASVSNSLSIAVSLSESLTERAVGHAVCFMDAQLRITCGVENMADHAKMVRNIVNLRTKDEPFNSAEAFVSLRLGEGYSKVIYITREYNPKLIRLMAQDTDLTLIVTSDAPKSVFGANDGYKIASLSAESLFQKTHTISL